MHRLALMAAAFLVAGTTVSAAADYPTRTITVMVPHAAGGPTDTVARLVTESMTRTLGQQLIVENQGGAGGTLGTGRAARAEADGYTLLLHHVALASSASLYRKLPFDPATSFVGVGLITDVPMTIVGKADLKPNTIGELLDYIRTNKDNVTYAHAGVGSASHLCGMLFQDALDVQMTTVPYKGTGPAMTDTMGGQVDLLCDQTTGATNPVQSKAVKAYATATKERIAVLPDVPTALEQGLDGFEIGVWHGMYVPAGTPEPVKERLTDALQKALQDETVIRRFAELGTEPVPQEDATPQSLEKQYKEQIEFWRPLIEEAGEYAN